MTVFDNVKAALLGLEDAKENRALLNDFITIPPTNPPTTAVYNDIRSRIVKNNNRLGNIGDLANHVNENGFTPAPPAGNPPIDDADHLTNNSAAKLRQIAICRWVEFQLKDQLKKPYRPPVPPVAPPQYPDDDTMTMLRVLANLPVNGLTPDILKAYADKLSLKDDQIDLLDRDQLESIRRKAFETLITAKILAVKKEDAANLEGLAKASRYGEIREQIFNDGFFGDFSSIDDELSVLPDDNNPTGKLKFQAQAMRFLLEVDVPDDKRRGLMFAASRDAWTAIALYKVFVANQSGSPAFDNDWGVLDQMTAKIFSRIAEPRGFDPVFQRSRAAIALVNHRVPEDIVLEILGQVQSKQQADAVIALAGKENVEIDNSTGIIVNVGLDSNRVEAIKTLVETGLPISSAHISDGDMLDSVSDITGEPSANKASIIGVLLTDVPNDQWKDLLESFNGARAGVQTETLATALKNIPATDPEFKVKRRAICNMAEKIFEKTNQHALASDITPEVIEEFWAIDSLDIRRKVGEEFVQLLADERSVDAARAVDHFTRVEQAPEKVAIPKELAKAGVKKGFVDGGLSPAVINALYDHAMPVAAFDITVIQEVITLFGQLPQDKQNLVVINCLIQFKDDKAALLIIKTLLTNGMQVVDIRDEFIDKIKNVPDSDRQEVAKSVADSGDPAQRTGVMDEFAAITEAKNKTLAVPAAVARYRDDTPEMKRKRELVMAFANADLATEDHLNKRIIEAISKIKDDKNRDDIQKYFLDPGSDKFGISPFSRLKAAIVLEKARAPTLAILEKLKAAQAIVIEKVTNTEAIENRVNLTPGFIESYSIKILHTNDKGEDLQEANMTDKLSSEKRTVGYRSKLSDGLGKDGAGTEISEYTADTATAKRGNIEIQPPDLTDGKFTLETAKSLARYMALRDWKSININAIPADEMVDVDIDGDIHEVPFKTLVYLAATAATEQGIRVLDGSTPLPSRSQQDEVVKYLKDSTPGLTDELAEALVKKVFEKVTSVTLGPSSP